jgi:hypothetical protein
MIDIENILLYGGILSSLASIYVIAVLYINPRLVLKNYRKDIQRRVAPLNNREKRLSLLVGIPFIVLAIIIPFISTLSLKQISGHEIQFSTLFLNTFGIGFMFNVVDLIVLDWFMFCTLTPKFIVLPGTEGMQAYKDYLYHIRGAVVGTIISVIAGLVIACVVSFL